MGCHSCFQLFCGMDSVLCRNQLAIGMAGGNRFGVGCAAAVSTGIRLDTVGFTAGSSGLLAFVPLMLAFGILGAACTCLPVAVGIILPIAIGMRRNNAGQVFQSSLHLVCGEVLLANRALVVGCHSCFQLFCGVDGVLCRNQLAIVMVCSKLAFAGLPGFQIGDLVLALCVGIVLAAGAGGIILPAVIGTVRSLAVCQGAGANMLSAEITAAIGIRIAMVQAVPLTIAIGISIIARSLTVQLQRSNGDIVISHIRVSVRRCLLCDSRCTGLRLDHATFFTDRCHIAGGCDVDVALAGINRALHSNRCILCEGLHGRGSCSCRAVIVEIGSRFCFLAIGSATVAVVTLPGIQVIDIYRNTLGKCAGSALGHCQLTAGQHSNILANGQIAARFHIDGKMMADGHNILFSIEGYSTSKTSINGEFKVTDCNIAIHFNHRTAGGLVKILCEAAAGNFEQHIFIIGSTDHFGHSCLYANDRNIDSQKTILHSSRLQSHGNLHILEIVFTQGENFSRVI